MEQKIIDTSIDLVKPVLEKSVLFACYYCEACDRNCITSDDIRYAMKYCAMHEVGKANESLFPEIY